MTAQPGLRDPHGGQPIMQHGVALDTARAVVVLLHGRGSAAEEMLGLAGELPQANIAYLALQAAGNTWYPHRFLEPLARNEPFLGSALRAVGRAVALATTAGVPADRIVLLGFSQGACLVVEWAARNAQRLGGVVGLSGGLIGPDDATRTYPGDLAGTPVFLGCSDHDSHIPKQRVLDTGAILQRMGAATALRLYPRMGHTINEDELAWVRELLTQITTD